MMHIQIVVVGKLKGGFSYLQAGIDDYLQRLRPFAKVTFVEVPDEPIRPSVTDEQVMAREGERILPYIQRSRYAVALSERGEQLGSEQFAKAWLDRVSANTSSGGMPEGGGGPIIVIVGGPLGLHPSVLNQCQWTVSLSKMTFPHPLVRLILLEQLYRAFKIQRGEPYHK
jgi:23S rRNA (pseudouridine1915-N3)-methyltransferase